VNDNEKEFEEPHLILIQHNHPASYRLLILYLTYATFSLKSGHLHFALAMIWISIILASKEVLFAIVRKVMGNEVAKSLKTMVARDGVEPPTPAFSVRQCALQA